MPSFIFSVLTSNYNFSRRFIFFLISKHNNFLQSWQQNRSYTISQFINFWVDKLLFTYGVMYLCESCWMMFSICLYIVSEIHSPFLVVNGCNFSCWQSHFFINKVWGIIWCCVPFCNMFSHRIHGQHCFNSITIQP